MIDSLKKIIRKEIKKETKKNVYRKIITIDESKVKSLTIGKLSY